ncbi:PTR2-domain-containing protein [Pseudovirgaria hyperparasitica]|uniref:PTR2-domain-containing protein n=1 Tax=Pseudovirgaria hyperparasitica TaxID=470096 RepID=A0A6A6WHU7_9PEZI|nr:PTR2-domain-containing protein [Pseudovirgaria hyperparasitica]KAF2762383.1 PTR2-domain-containing protein [Pseudovirgaria hyperparasitica]
MERGSSISDTDDELDLVIPTEEELHTLKRVPGVLPWIAFTVAFVELCERFSYYGTVAIFVNFIQRDRPVIDGVLQVTGADPRPDGRPGAIGAGQRASFGLTTFNRFWAYFMPLFGAYIADTYWGRYKTIHASIVVCFFGHCIIIISAIPKVLDHPQGALGCFAVGLVFFGIGVGGFKSNISPMVAEQLRAPKIHVQTNKSGQRVIVDPALTTQRMFMWFYLFINIGAVTGQVSMVYAERYVGFWLSFFLPTIMLMLCPVVLIAFNKKYHHSPPTGSILGTFFKLISLGFKGKTSINPAVTWRNMRDPAFFEDIKPSRVANKPDWMVFDDAWVDEVARATKACTVFLFFPIFWLAYNQIESNLTSQAATMELHGVPNDLLNNLNPIGIIIMIPILDVLVYPLIRKAGLNFTPLKRMTAGFFLGCAAMIWAAVIQHYIYEKGACGKYMNTCETPDGDALPAPINVWAQTGSYILVGLAEIMASITGLEYAYTKAPVNMRSLVMGFYQMTSALSAALGQAFVALSEDPLLVWNYGAVAIIAFVGGVAFWVLFRKYDQQEDKLNLIKESEYRGTNRPGQVDSSKLDQTADARV